MEYTIYNKVKNSGISKTDIRRVVAFVFLARHQASASISIHLIGDTRMKRLNHLYRGQATTTDVLSFAVQENNLALDPHDWGDMFLSVPTIRRQAKRAGIPYREELYRLLIHGTLHLLGFDHQKSAEAKKMFALQEKLLTGVL